MTKDIGAICIAWAIAGAAYWIIIEWLDQHLLDDYLQHLDAMIVNEIEVGHFLLQVGHLWDWPSPVLARLTELIIEPRGLKID